MASGASIPDMINILKDRFDRNIHRHIGLEWADVRKRLTGDILSVLKRMEDTGGEPDVVGYDPKSRLFIFMDCATETPKGRRSICYDQAALHARKENKPADSAMNMAAEMGV